MSLDYYRSERFIHDDLLQKAQKTVDQLYPVWKKLGRIDPVLLTWPAEPLKDINGETVTGVCIMDLPADRSQRHKAMVLAVEASKAYGLLLLDQGEESIKALLETPHGTRSWTLPIKRSADVNVLGEATIEDNAECVGLIWRPNKGTA